MYNNNVPSYPPPGYHNTNPQFHNQQYSQEYSSTFGYQDYGVYPNQASANQPPQSTSGQEGFSTSNWTSYQPNQNDAVAQEMRQQNAQLIKQREDYVQKSIILRHELEQLQLQKQDLVGNGDSPNSDLSNILQHNAKLQEEIHGKMKAIRNVIEMLSGIIKDGKSITELEDSVNQTHSQQSKSRSSSPKLTTESLNEKGSRHYCYVHYDAGLHWCRMCDVFPNTAKDFLLHLQEKKHKAIAKETDVDVTPWHKLPQEVLMPSDENAPQKRIPIKGLQFFVSAPSWYCKLCDVWIGDLHCASQHLKSQTHHHNYENFVTQHPHWEMEWIKDRENAMSRLGVADSTDSDDDRKKRRRKGKHSSSEAASKEKKKKKRSKRKRRHSSDSSSSSSSSDSSSDDETDDKTKSIRVAMRNMQKVQSIMDEDLSAKWNVLEKLVEEHKKKEMKEKQEKRETAASEDTLINQWMTVSQPPPKEKVLLNSLKDRMRHKQELERTRVAEIEKLKREKQREELEKMERRKREDREREEQIERHRKQREQEELDRIRDKERSQVRFKTANNMLRRRKRSASRSDEEDNLDKLYRYDRRNNGREDREDSFKRSRSKSYEQEEREQSERRHEEVDSKKKPPGPPSYKKLPFIGRMPLFKNKSKTAQDEKEESKEIKKQSYDPQRKTRFEPGNLPKAFIPKPEVVHFPKLSSIPPLTVPPPPPIVVEKVPKTRNIVKHEALKAPPPPKFDKKETREGNLSDDEVLYGSDGVNPSMMGQYYQEYSHNMYSYPIQANEEPVPPPPPPHSHSMPLEPPPLPPDDDLALLGICADDMAAQSF